MNHDTILSALNWRYATKKYDPTKKISASDWNVLAESLRLAPSSYGLQPWKFLVIENPKVRAELRPHSWGQSAIEEASHLVVFTTLKKMTGQHIAKHVEQIAETRGVDVKSLEGFQTFMNQKILQEKPLETHQGWNQRQAYIAMGFLLETAALLKIDATPIEGITPEEYDKILKLDQTEYATVAVVALGYRAADDAYQSNKKSRFPLNQVIEYVK